MRSRAKSSSDAPAPGSDATPTPLPEADCDAAAPGIGGFTACHALKLTAFTFALLSLAIWTGTLDPGAEPLRPESRDQAAGRPAGATGGLGAIRPVAQQQADSGAGAEPMPVMDAAPRSQPHRDYGLPKDHPYTPPEERETTQMTRPLRTASWYSSKGGVLHTAGRGNDTRGVFRTHEADPDPIVVTFEDVLDEAAAARVIAAALPKMRRAGVTADNGGTRKSDGRSNDLTWLSHSAPEVAEMVAKVAELVGVPASHAEQLQVVHYEEQQQYRKHWDAYDRRTERGAKMMRSHGNRVLTALVYLAEPEEGGETTMVNLGLKIAPKLGRLLIFHNTHLGSSTRHPDSNHAAMPVRRGEKWAMNLWFREVPMR